ncbi:ATP phosphoribosyltransferase regulatory subunit [Pelagibacteraceae bacterium]|nr:ATP phosphoribosyltransferase regulatory subunit [Pelagibacteraceae bacterium]
MVNKSLIPEGFKDHVDFNTNVEHEYKNTIIDIFISNGFDLVKTPLLEFYKNNSSNCFFIDSKKNDPKLFVRDDITPQIIRVTSSRLNNKIRPMKLCYYGEVIRKKGSMLRPERQFLQVGSEIIGSDSILADIEIIRLAYRSLKKIGIKNITLELTSNVFLDIIFSKIKDPKTLKKLKIFIHQKDKKNSLNLINSANEKLFLENLFTFTGNFNDLIKSINKLSISDETKQEIQNIKTIVKMANFQKNDQIFLDLTEINRKNYHHGIKFTFFAKNVRGEIASGGRYKIKNKLREEPAIGFTCFMDTVLRASSFENSSKKILVPFKIKDNIKNNLIKKNYIVFTFFGDISDIAKFAKKYFCTYVYENNRIKKI